MSSGADLFVVCKQCGSEVSPYITECPYCGSRLRRRAPKLPRERESRGPTHRPRIPMPPLGRLRRGEIAGVRAEAPPYATIALVLAGCIALVLTSGGYLLLGKVVAALQPLFVVHARRFDPVGDMAHTRLERSIRNKAMKLDSGREFLAQPARRARL